jgi:hypothetical protein
MARPVFTPPHHHRDVAWNLIMADDKSPPSNACFEDDI